MSDIIEVRQGKAGKWYWVKKASNGEIVSTSESYTRRRDALRSANREKGSSDAIVSLAVRQESE